MSAGTSRRRDAQPPRPGAAAAAIVAAATVWGLSPIYYKALSHVPPIEILAHRTLWSLFFIGGFAALSGRGPEALRALAERASARALAFAAAMISVNWLLFIWSVQSGRAVEASLGYYIFPLVAAGLGAAWLGERFNRAQAAALALALAATGLLTWGIGRPPWIALALAFSFGLYGIAKKGLSVGPIAGVAAEVALLAPIAALWLAGAHLWGWSDFTGKPGGLFGEGWRDSAMLAFSGVLTGAPLILFSLAARRLRYATVGLISYLNPTLQFLCATLLFAEPLSPWHGPALALIWLGLAIYTRDGLAQERRARRAAAELQRACASTRSSAASASGAAASEAGTSAPQNPRA
ncbi:EamA family transporter RarD [Oceanicella actignis]|uniref:EamA family transporter RarD n=1 Tax=Oceanicella actignis TaxID=1189325 RepID=UPI0011E65CC3|nr:EamA family transporter RarD [Oceanicella actignis]TYO89941.1 chloramphenicol-sensitive protein RarD [Oceanicella actignis]